VGVYFNCNNIAYLTLSIDTAKIQLLALLIANLSKTLLLKNNVLKGTSINIDYDSEIVCIKNKIRVPMEIYQTDINMANIIFNIPETIQVITDQDYCIPPCSIC
jgi:hypothetical protein